MALPSHIWTVGSLGSSITSNGNFSTTLDDDIIIESLALTNTTSPAATIPAGYTQLSDVQVGTTAGNTIRLITVWARVSAGASAPVWSSITGLRFICTTNIRGCISSVSPVAVTDDGTSTGASLSMALGTSSYTDIMVVHHTATERDYTGAWMGARANANLSSLTEQYDACFSTSTGIGRGCITGTKTTTGALGTTTVATNTDNMAWCAVALRSTTSTGGGGNNGGFFAFF